MFTYGEDGLREISINDDKYFLMSGKSISDFLEQVDRYTFKTMEYREYNPTLFYEHYYQWNGIKFVEIKTEMIPLVSENNVVAKPEYMSFWPEYRISLYTLNEPEDGESKGEYKGFYLYVNGKETYFPDWTGLYNRPPELVSIHPAYDPVLFGIVFTTGYGTGLWEGYTKIFNVCAGEIIELTTINKK